VDPLGDKSSLDQEFTVESVQENSEDIAKKETSRSVTVSSITEPLCFSLSFEQKYQTKEAKVDLTSMVNRIVDVIVSDVVVTSLVHKEEERKAITNSMVTQILDAIVSDAVVMSLARKDQQDKAIFMSTIMNEILEGIVCNVVQNSPARKEKHEKEIRIAMVTQILDDVLTAVVSKSMEKVEDDLADHASPDNVMIDDTEKNEGLTEIQLLDDFTEMDSPSEKDLEGVEKEESTNEESSATNPMDDVIDGTISSLENNIEGFQDEMNQSKTEEKNDDTSEPLPRNLMIEQILNEIINVVIITTASLSVEERKAVSDDETDSVDESFSSKLMIEKILDDVIITSEIYQSDNESVSDWQGDYEDVEDVHRSYQDYDE